MSCGVDPRPVVPAVAAPGRQEGARALRVVDGVDAVAVLADDLPQRRPEDRRDDVAEAVGSAHGDPEPAADRAARAVGGHEVTGADGADVAARDVAQHDLDALWQAPHLDHLGVEVHAGAGEGAQVLEQHGLEVILRHAGGCGRAEQGGLLARRDAGRPHRPVGHRGQGAGQPSVPLDVDGFGADGVLDAPGADELHRAQAHRGRPGQRRQLGPALDEHGLHAEAREGDGGRQPGRAGAHDDDRNVFGVHGHSHFVGQYVFHKTSCQANIV